MISTRCLSVAVVFACLLVAGCGDEGGEEAASTEERPKKVVIKNVNEDGEFVEGRTVEVSGVVSQPNATVQVGDRETKADARGVFSVKVRLPEVGENTIYVDARKPGFKSDSMTIYITRELTAEERRARAERRRERRERELAELRATAQAIDPELLQKDPDRYAGQPVVMSGEIFQIQEGGANFLLMDTMCETEYDIRICDGPTVYVSYGFPTDATEEDYVTVYGIVQGGYEYETQIGGSNYVAHIEARIIE